MSLNAIRIATSGLGATQATIDVIAGNIANAGTAGYVRRSVTTVATATGNGGSGVRLGEIERALGPLAQRQLRLETAGAAYTARAASSLGQLDALFGAPGSPTSLDGSVNAFASALQTLQAEPNSTSARSGAVTAAQALAARIGRVAEGVQGLRTDAEAQLGRDVGAASGLLARIADLNVKALDAHGTDPSILDARDAAVDQLSAYMDVTTREQPDGSLTVLTGSGVTLVDRANAAKLTFDARAQLSANAVWTSDAKTRGTGTITATLPGGSTMDFVGTGAIRSGSIAANLDLRDKTLVRAQRGLDELAAGLAQSFSDTPATGTAAGGAVDIDLTGIQAGNAITLDGVKADGKTPVRYVLVPTGTAGANRELPSSPTDDPGAIVITFDVTKVGADDPAASAAVLANRINTAITAAEAARAAATPPATVTDLGLSFSAAAGKLRAAGDGSAVAITPKAASASVTAADPANDGRTGKPQFSLFADTGFANATFTSYGASGARLTGFAQRLAVNPAVVSDTSRLVAMSATTLPNDATRPNFLVAALTSTNRTFGAAAGIGGTSAPYSGSVQDFALRLVETQGAAAAGAASLDEGQQVALSSARGRFAEESGVSIDSEMAQLVQLQTAYSANARVLAAARDMLDTLLRI